MMNKHKKRFSKIETLYDGDIAMAKKIIYDRVGLYSFTNQTIGKKISEKILTLDNISQSSIITDTTASIGGISLCLMNYFNNINLVELNCKRYDMLVHNVNAYKIHYSLTTEVKFYNTNWLNISYLLYNDVIFIDAPWMTPEMVKNKVWYKDLDKIHLYLLNDKDDVIDLEDIVPTLTTLCKYIVLKVPYNFDMDSFNSKINGLFTVIDLDFFDQPNTMIIIYLKSNRSHLY